MGSVAVKRRRLLLYGEGSKWTPANVALVFAVHDTDYRTSWKDWESFVESLTEKIVEKDDTIPELPPKDLVGWSSCGTHYAACVDEIIGLQSLSRRSI